MAAYENGLCGYSDTVHEFMHERASMFNNRLPALHRWKVWCGIVIEGRRSAVMKDIGR